MIVAVLNGWGSSSRNRETRTAALVRDATDDIKSRTMLAKRSMIGWARARRFRKFILEHQDPKQSLLCVGKSLGARNMVSRILNKLEPLEYYKTGLFTIDPCWPIKGDWKPNLNEKSLQLTHKIDKVINLYAVLPKDQQAGSRVFGDNVRNFPISDADHYSIVQHDLVADELGDLVIWLTS
jgi:hypothetical protein